MRWIKIDLEQYPRREHYEHYLHRVRCGYGMTVQIDVTEVVHLAKEKGIPFYAAEIYMLSRVVNAHPEFRMCRNENGELGYWESSNPSYTVFHRDTETFSSIWTEYSSDFREFLQNYREDAAQYGNCHAFDAKPGQTPNMFNVSSIPWAHYTDFHLDLFDGGDYLLPIFTLGKYEGREERLFLPVTAQVHHAVCDGFHLSRFMAELQALADSAGEWLKT